MKKMKRGRAKKAQKRTGGRGNGRRHGTTVATQRGHVKQCARCLFSELLDSVRIELGPLCQIIARSFVRSKIRGDETPHCRLS